MALTQAETQEFKTLDMLVQRGAQLTPEEADRYNQFIAYFEQEQRTQARPPIGSQHQHAVGSTYQHNVQQNRSAVGNSMGYVQKSIGANRNVHQTPFNSMVNTQAKGTDNGVDLSRYTGDNHVNTSYVEPKAKQQAHVEPEVVETPIDQLPPFVGNEYPFLTPPTMECYKKRLDGAFYYAVREKELKEGETLKYNEHAAVYDNANFINTVTINDKDDKQVNILDFVTTVRSKEEMKLKMGYIVNDLDSLYTTTAAAFDVIDTFLVNKRTNDPTKYLVANKIVATKNLEELANVLLVEMKTHSQLTSKAFEEIDLMFTKQIVTLFRCTLGSDASFDSFANDYKELKAFIEKLADQGKKALFNSTLADFYTNTKLNASALLKNDFKVTDPDPDSKVTETYISNRYTRIHTTNEDAQYEISDLDRGVVSFIKAELTPVLFNIIETVMDHGQFNKLAPIILTANDNQVYQILKSKSSNFYTIEKQ